VSSTADRPTAGERLAALVALLALAAAVVLLVAGVVLHIAGALLTIIGALVCVTAGWYAVSRRGVVRVIAVLVAVAAVAGLITSLVFEDYDGLAVLGLIVVAAVSVVSARYALRAPAQRARLAAMNATPVARAGHPVLIMNLKSGGGKAEKFRLADECEKRGIEPIVLVFESLPGALRVRLPGSVEHPSRARPVRLLSGSTIAQLALVVAGRYG